MYPDETSQIPAALRNQIVSQSPFCAPVSANLQWNRWDAGKHLVYILAQQYSSMAMEADPRKNANAAIDLLGNALTLHMAIQQNNVFLADDTNAYQGNWKLALEDLLKDGKADFDFLELMP